jgi:acyl-CoA dehydrogenase
LSELDQLRSLVANVADKNPPSDLWPTLRELGLATVGIDEALGGAGGTTAELVAVSEVLGRKGRSTPLVSANTADWILAENRLLGDSPPVAIAVVVDTTEDALREGTLTVESIPWGRSAQSIVLIPTTGFPVRVDVSGYASVREGVDLARTPSDTLTISGDAPRTSLVDGPSSAVALSRLALVRAAALTGAIRGVYELTSDYVRTREQFGAPLIAIPAVAANLARIRTRVIEVEAALSSGLLAGGRDAADMVPMIGARILSAAGASETARLAHQLHGAIGTTDEYPLHLLTRLLWAWRDADLPEAAWSRMLADSAVERGEEWLWTASTIAG